MLPAGSAASCRRRISRSPDGRRRPREHGAERSTAQRLFGRPQDVGLLRLDDEHSFEPHASLRQRRHERNVRRGISAMWRSVPVIRASAGTSSRSSPIPRPPA